MADGRKKHLYFLVGVFLVLAAFAVSYTQLLYSADKLISDPLYQTGRNSSRVIKILAIDERTIQSYGDMKNWDRNLWADLVEKLNSGERTPAVIGLDILFVSQGEEEADDRFAKECAAGGNVVTAVNAVYGDQIQQGEDGTYSVERNAVKMVEYPYPALAAAAEYGFANTLQDPDGYIRYARTALTDQGAQIDSFPVTIYRKYCAFKGAQPNLPETTRDGVFFFAYAGESGAYETISLCDVLDGKVDVRIFANCIVLVGAYAPGMQDAYNVPIQKGKQMYGVEIQANILQALIDGATGVPGSNFLYALAVAAAVAGFYWFCTRQKMIPAACLLLGLIGADGAVSIWLFHSGVVVSLIEFPIFGVLIYIVQLIWWYFQEVLQRRKVISAFRKYVAPQVVEEISKKGDFKITLGGENRDIAVLFVDIRGFTPMSENLKPEQVVQILNEYLTLTTHAIFANGGTLDKFIGDATMAVFNAPFDLENYVYRAVCTARDIAAGSEALEKKLMERFGRSVSFGIGVNCGEAVVGNIGCEFRMDYTAIGDTVNTAARLESNAKPGQILISEAVYQSIKDRLEVTPIGTIPLKGKSQGVMVYQVDRVLP